MKTKKRKIIMIIIVAITMFIITYLFAEETKILNNQENTIKSSTGWFKVTGIHHQPDGTDVSYDFISGYKNTNLFHSLINEYSVLIDDKTGYLCWAMKTDDGDIESTGYPVHLYEPEEFGLEKHIWYSDEKVKEQEDILEKKLKNNRNRFIK